MKKTLIISLIDGREIKRDITNKLDVAPIGAPANDPGYAMLCQSVAATGVTDPDPEAVSEKRYKFLGASQIKSVEVVFE